MYSGEVARGDVVNVGNPKEITILGLVKKIKELTRSESPLTFHPLPEDDPTSWFSEELPPS